MKLKVCLMMLIIISPSLAFANNVFNGKDVYSKECVSCHGHNGAGEMPGVPNFTESNILFKMNRELINVVNDGIGIMPGYRGLLTDEEIQDVVAYLRTFR